MQSAYILIITHILIAYLTFSSSWLTGEINETSSPVSQQPGAQADSVNYVIYELEGTYQGKDLIVYNPLLMQFNCYVVKEVIINDKYKLPTISGNKFIVPLDKFKMGQYLNIKIIHRKNYRPRIQEPDYILSASTFEIVSATIDETSIKWTATHESNQQPYYIEQYKYQKWVTLGKVIAKGISGNNSYSFTLNHHSGINTYRIKQRDIGRGYVYTDQMEYESKKPAVTFQVAGNQIIFSDPTDYEIFELSGAILIKGYGKSVNIGEIKPQNYYLNMDNRLEYLNLAAGGTSE